MMIARSARHTTPDATGARRGEGDETGDMRRQEWPHWRGSSSAAWLPQEGAAAARWAVLSPEPAVDRRKSLVLFVYNSLVLFRLRAVSL
jgi:hypothetical protein